VRGIGAPVTPYELMVRTIARARGLTIQLDHQRARFTDATVAGWLARYVAIARALAADPDARLSAREG
jgi:ABC-type transporter Mla maintaining outer membrane lipid asymmetry ATPase subunit MlaF